MIAFFIKNRKSLFLPKIPQFSDSKKIGNQNQKLSKKDSRQNRSGRNKRNKRNRKNRMQKFISSDFRKNCKKKISQNVKQSGKKQSGKIFPPNNAINCGKNSKNYVADSKYAAGKKTASKKAQARQKSPKPRKISAGKRNFQSKNKKIYTQKTPQFLKMCKKAKSAVFLRPLSTTELQKSKKEKFQSEKSLKTLIFQDRINKFFKIQVDSFV